MNISYLIFIPLVFLASSKVLLHSMISRNYLKNSVDVTIYNSIVFGSMTLIYLLLNGTNIPSVQILPYGFAYGAILASYQVLYTMAFQRGPVSLTALIASFNNIFTIAFGILYCGESLRVINILGLGCMFLSLFLTADFKQSKERQFNVAWFPLSLAAMAAMVISNIILKLQKMAIPDQDISILLVTYFSGTMVLLLYYGFQTKVLRQKQEVVLLRSRVVAMLGVSAILGTYFILYLIGIGIIPSVIFFPVVNIAPTTMVSILGVFLFHDKMNKRQKWSMVFGIAATVLLCL